MPPRAESLGLEAADFVASCGLKLDEWQRLVLDDALGIRPDGNWSAFEVGLIVPRQQGKGAVLEAREIAGLFLLGERLILHTAHEFKTAAEAFRRVLAIVDNTDHLRKRVKRVRTSHGDEGIELIDGARLRFVARSTGSGRGFTGDCVILDEAYNLSAAAMAALLPTMSAVPNPQLWYTSSSGTVGSDQLRAVRQRGMSDDAGRLCYLEWSAPKEARDTPWDRKWWWMANPALGIRVAEEFVEAEYAAMAASPDDFCRERLGLFDELALEEDALPGWLGLTAPSAIVGELAIAVDVSPDRRWTSIAVSGKSDSGGQHLEVIDHLPGTSKAVARLVELVARWKPVAVALDPAGPAGSLLADLERAGVEVRSITQREHGQACGMLWDDVTEKRIVHLGDPVLNQAVAGARRRLVGDSWLWDRKKSDVDISPLVAVTLARWVHTATNEAPKPVFAY